jgi:hypothetical protein
VKNTLDFIVIGAQKAGTTSLFEYLRRHPELSLPPGKEVPFFSHEAIRARGWDDYMGKAFAFAEQHSQWGTATPQYMVGGLWEQPNPLPSGDVYDERTVPLRIHERIPEVRLIAILRDPAERARSHHRMAVMNGIDKRSFRQAIDELLQSESLEQARREPRETTGYVAWGEYGRILTGYFDVFPREQILVLFTKELESEPERLLRYIYDFLSVRADFIPDNIGARYRAGGTERRFSWLGTYSRLSPWAIQRTLTDNPTARGLWHALPEPTRRRIDRVFARVAYRMDLWNRRTKVDAVDSDDATLERLRVHYTQDTQRLAALLKTDPPWQR